MRSNSKPRLQEVRTVNKSTDAARLGFRLKNEVIDRFDHALPKRYSPVESSDFPTSLEDDSDDETSIVDLGVLYPLVNTEAFVKVPFGIKLQISRAIGIQIISKPDGCCFGVDRVKPDIPTELSIQRGHHSPFFI
jgi:hypothetical protein